MTHARVDAYNLNGTLLARVDDIESISFTRRLHEVGTFNIALPALTTYADTLVGAYEVRVYEDNDGLVFRGLVANAQYEFNHGSLMVVLEGDELSRELVHANTTMGLQFFNTPLNVVVNDLLYGTGWGVGQLHSTSLLLNAQFNGLSVWEALNKVGEIYHVSLRGNLDRTIDFAEFGTEQPIVLRNSRTGSVRSHGLDGFTVANIRLEEDGSDLWNRVIALGAGEGENTLHLGFSDRPGILTGQHPAGAQYHYIQDATSIAQHGLRTKVLSYKDVAPLSNSDNAFRLAANTLYDHAHFWLGQHSEKLEYYDIEVPGFPKSAIALGEKLRLVYRGVVEQEDRRIYKNVDEYMYLMGYERYIDRESDVTKLQVANMPRHKIDVGAEVAHIFSEMHAVQVSLRPFTYREVHGPQKQSVNNGNPARFFIDFDNNVAMLHSTRLRVNIESVRSNVTGSAAGGATVVSSSAGGGTNPTSTGGGSFNATSSSGGGTSTTTGASSSSTTSQNGNHFHVYSVFIEWWHSGPWSTPATSWNLVSPSTGSAGDHTHGMSHTHGFSIPNHSHTVSVGNHSHTVSIPDHSHTTTLPNHTHSLIYGIYIGPSVSNPLMNVWVNNVNRTAALGGPWNNSFEVDITQYLSGNRGQPLRQQNEIRISSAVLADVEMQSKSLVTAYSAIPIA